jgi:MFS family permease
MIARSLASLAVPNFRRYFLGQVVSLGGNWAQVVGESWLVLKLTGSGVDVGVISALQFLPILLLSASAGVLADRFDKRRILLVTQPLMAAPALALWALYETGHASLLAVYALVLVRGTINAIDNPPRNSFLYEIVGPERLVNAVSLNNVVIHSARITGPALAAVLIAAFGVGPCFLVNALSFGASFVALWRMDVAQLRPSRRVARARGQVRDALREVRRRADLRTPLAMMGVIGLFALNYQALLPLLASFEWHGSATTYSLLAIAMGAGSVAGAVASATHGRVSPGLLTRAAALVGVTLLAAAAAPTAAVQALALAAAGAVSVLFAAGVNSTVQLAAGEELRGRVIALYMILFLGTTPIGGPLAGALADADARLPLLVGAAAALLAAAGSVVARRRERVRACVEVAA